MEVKKENPENPWAVSHLDDFLYYNCPECDTKSKDSKYFIEHALNAHEHCKPSILPLIEDQAFVTDVTENLEIDVKPDVTTFWDDYKEEKYDVTENDDVNYDVMEDDDVTESESEEFECDLCYHIFKSQTGLNNHKRKCGVTEKISKNEIFKCDMCDTTFNSNVGLTNHRRKCGNSDISEEVECDICHTKYKSSHGLKNHRKKCEQIGQVCH